MCGGGAYPTSLNLFGRSAESRLSVLPCTRHAFRSRERSSPSGSELEAAGHSPAMQPRPSSDAQDLDEGRQ